MLRGSVAAFHKAGRMAVAGLTLSLLMWLVAFLSIGGEWFLMWQSKAWNGQGTAFRMFTVVGIVLLLMATPERALETHAREELGIDPEALGSPLIAAGASFVSFAVGALVPLAGFWWTGGGAAQVAALVLTAVAAVAVGIAVSLFASTSWWRSVVRQLAICGAAVGVSFLLGSLIGLSGV